MAHARSDAETNVWQALATLVDAETREAAEAALRAFPIWPFYTRPLVRFGSWWICRGVDRNDRS